MRKGKRRRDKMKKRKLKKDVKKYNYLELFNLLIPFRFYLFLIIIILGGTYLSRFFDNNFVKDSYFWVLSSLIQGFSAFFGVIVALLVIEFKKIDKKELINKIKDYILPLSLSAITLIYSIFGVMIYPILKSNYLLAQFIIIASSFAIWSILEIFFVILKYLSNPKIKS